MLPPTHFIVSFFFALIGVKLGYFTFSESVLIALLSTLIDLDHVFAYYHKHKKWNLKEAWNAAIVRHEQESSFIQHEQGFYIVIILLLGLFFISKHIVLILALAYYTHFLLDHIHIKLKEHWKIKKIWKVTIPIHTTEIIFNIISIIGIIYLIIVYFLW